LKFTDCLMVAFINGLARLRTGAKSSDCEKNGSQ